MKYDLTSGLIFFRPVTKVKYITNCRAVFYFKEGIVYDLYRIVVLGNMRNMIHRERSYWFSNPGRFWWVSIFLE